MSYTQHSRSSKTYSPNDVVLTPKLVFDQLGVKFDLDPAHPPFPTNVPCKRYYTEKDDGLAQPWEGLVWLNPPYSNPTPWIEKWLSHGNGIMLVQVSRSNAYLKLWNDPNVRIVHQRGKHMAFDLPDGSKKGIFMPVALFAIGSRAINILQAADLGQMR